MKKIYFGHPLNTYNTDLEKELLNKISEVFPDWVIENPNTDFHDICYKMWDAQDGNGMIYFYSQVLPKCNAGIFLPMRDGKFTSGVVGEIEWFLGKELPVWQIDLNGDITILELDDDKILSIEETRERINRPY